VESGSWIYELKISKVSEGRQEQYKQDSLTEMQGYLLIDSDVFEICVPVWDQAL
jgi:hypothetical protein